MEKLYQLLISKDNRARALYKNEAASHNQPCTAQIGPLSTESSQPIMNQEAYITPLLCTEARRCFGFNVNLPVRFGERAVLVFSGRRRRVHAAGTVFDSTKKMHLPQNQRLLLSKGVGHFSKIRFCQLTRSQSEAPLTFSCLPVLRFQPARKEHKTAVL